MRPFAFFLTASLLCAQEYWPLATGNQWVYRSTNIGEPWTVSVDRQETATNGRTYAIVNGLGATLWLRHGDDGVIYTWNPNTRAESTYLDFSTDRAAPTAADPCHRTSTITDRDARQRLPLGDYGGLIQVRYQIANCADAGIDHDLWLPYVGLMRRTLITIAGPRPYDLVYARINGVLMLTAPETSLSISATTDGPRLLARLTLRTSQPLRLQFADGQQYDFTLTNDKGEIVHRWSNGRAFTQAMTSLEINGERNWTVTLPRPVAPGRYRLEGWLTTPENQSWRATTTLDIN